MKKGLQHLVDHAKVVVSLKLPFHIDEVFVEGVQTPREELAEMECDRRESGEKLAGIPDDVERTRGERTNCGGMWSSEQDRHFPEDGARLGGKGDGHLVLENFDLPVDEHVEAVGGFVLPDEGFPGINPADLAVLEKVKNGAHFWGVGMDPGRKGSAGPDRIERVTACGKSEMQPGAGTRADLAALVPAGGSGFQCFTPEDTRTFPGPGRASPHHRQGAKGYGTRTGS